MFTSIKDSIDINTRMDWKNYFMSLSYLIASRSSCDRLHVGCVLVKENHVISSGYNGFLAGHPHISRVRDNHEQATVHAEQNCIADCAKRGISTENSTAYITHYPCINCCKILLASGVKTIIYDEDYKNDNLVTELCNEANIKICKIIDLEK